MNPLGYIASKSDSLVSTPKVETPVSSDEQKLFSSAATLCRTIYEIDRSPEEMNTLLKDYLDQGWEVLTTSTEEGFTKERVQGAITQFKEIIHDRSSGSMAEMVRQQHELAPKFRADADQINDASKEHGYFGIVLIHPESQTLLKVNKGTDPNLLKAWAKEDLDADISLFFDKSHVQIERSVQFAKYAEQLAKEKYPHLTFEKISIGHSLGGFQSHLDAAMLDWKAIGYDNPLLSEKFLANYGKQVQVPFDDLSGNPNFLSFHSNPNLVNRGGGKVPYGVMYRVDVTGKEDFSLSIESHRMSHIEKEMVARRFSLTESGVTTSRSPLPKPIESVCSPVRSSDTLLSDVTSLESAIEEGRGVSVLPEGEFSDEKLEEITALLRRDIAELEKTQKLMKKAQKESLKQENQRTAAKVIKGFAEAAYIYHTDSLKRKERRVTDKDFERGVRSRIRRKDSRQTYQQVSLPQIEQRYFHRLNPIRSLLTAREMEQYAQKITTQHEKLIQEIETRRGISGDTTRVRGTCHMLENDLRDWHRRRTREFDHLSQGLSIVKGFLTVISCVPNPVVSAVAVAARTGVQAVSSSVDGKRDKVTRRYQREIGKSLETRDNLDSVDQENSMHIAACESAISREVYTLITSKGCLAPATYREKLQVACKAVEKKQAELNTKYETTKDAIGKKKAEIERYKQAWNKACAEESACKKKKRKYWNGQKTTAGQNWTKAAAELAALEARVINEEKAKDLHQEHVVDVARAELRHENLVAPVRDAFHERIQGELSRWEPTGTDEEIETIKKRRQTIEDEWRKWDQSRETERVLVRITEQAAKGLVKELGYMFGTDKPGVAMDILGQVYKFYDIGKDLNTGLSALGVGFDKLLEARKEAGLEGVMGVIEDSVLKAAFDKDGIAGVIEEVGGVAIFVTKFVVPGLQAVTALLVCARLASTLYKQNGEPTPQQRFLINTLNRAFEEFKKYVECRFDTMETIIGSNHKELKDDISTLKRDLILVGDEIIDEVRATAKDTQDDIARSAYERFIREIKNVRPEIKAIPLAPVRDSCRQFEMMLRKSLLPVNSGLTPGISDKGVGLSAQPNIGIQYLRRNPDCFTGLLAHKAQIREPIPNLFLYREIVARFLKYRAWSGLEEAKKDPDLTRKLYKLCQKMEKNGKLLQILFTSIDKLFIEAVTSREAIQDTIDDNRQAMEALRRKRKSHLIVPYTPEKLKEKRDLLLGRLFVGDTKFQLSNAFDEVSVGPSILKLDSKDSKLKLLETSLLAGVTGVASAAVPTIIVGGCVVSGELALATAATTLVTGGLAFAVAGAVGMFAIVTGFNVAESMSREMPAREFYSRVEAKLIREVSVPIKQLVTKHVIVANQDLASAASKLPIEGLRNVIIRCLYDRQSKGVYLRHRKYKNLGNGLTFGPKLPAVTNPLLRFNAVCNLKDLSVSTEFKANSILQREDIERITAFDVTGYSAKVRKLTSHYYDYLANAYHGAELKADNIFRPLSVKSQKVPSLNDQLPDLLFPTKFIEFITTRFKNDGGKMETSGVGTLVPRYRFFQSEDKTTWRMTIHFCFAESEYSELKDYGSIEIASFDHQTVSAFRQGKFEKGDTDTLRYTTGHININEFLIQAMYSGLIPGLGLPGSETHTVSKTGWVAPAERSFVGLSQLFEAAPQYRVTFNSASYTDDVKSYIENIVSDGFCTGTSTQLLKSDAIIHFNKDFVTVWKHINKKIKEKSKEYEKYVDLYNLLIGACRLMTDVDSESLTHLLSDRLGLVSPEELSDSIAHREVPAKTREDVIEFLSRLPSSEKEELDLLVSQVREFKESLGYQGDEMIPESEPAGLNPGGIINGGDTCYLASALQMILMIPELRNEFRSEADSFRAIGNAILTKIERGDTVSRSEINRFCETCSAVGLVKVEEEDQKDAQEILGKIVEYFGQSLSAEWVRSEQFESVEQITQRPFFVDEEPSKLSYISELAEPRKESTDLEVSPILIGGTIASDMQSLINAFWSDEKIIMNARKQEAGVDVKITGEARRIKRPIVESFPSTLMINVKQMHGTNVTPRGVKTIYPAGIDSAGDGIGPKYRLEAIIVRVPFPKHYYVIKRLSDGRIVACNDGDVREVGSLEGWPGCSYLYVKE